MSKQTQDDERWMRRCLELAARGTGRVSPNPQVGCVIVNSRGKLVAEGFHKKLGAAHAEADALAKIGGRAKGCTLYVNLEPCRHTKGRRTTPCMPKVLAAGIKRVVIGMLDPWPGHGGGAAKLAREGLSVTRGVLGDECKELNKVFAKWARERRPYIVVKTGMTADGCVATHTGESKWITGDAARRDSRALRGQLDAILVGVGTVLADDPRLTARGTRGRDPIRIVLDSKLRTPTDALLLPVNSAVATTKNNSSAKSSSKSSSKRSSKGSSGRTSKASGRTSTARVIIATKPGASRAREAQLVERGADVWRLPLLDGKLDLAALGERLAEEQIASVLVEGGPTIHASYMAAGLVDEVRLYVAPMVFGGAGKTAGLGWVTGPGAERIELAHRFVFSGEPRRVGSDLVLTMKPR